MTTETEEPPAETPAEPASAVGATTLEEVLPTAEPITPAEIPNPVAAEHAAELARVLDDQEQPPLSPELGPEPAPPAPPRNKGGRPKGSKTKTRTPTTAITEEPEPAVRQDPVAAVRGSLEFSFRAVGRMIATFRGQHWVLSDEEVKELAAVWAPVLAPYLEQSGEALKWVTAGMLTWGIVQPRLAKDKELAPVEISPGVTVHTNPPPGVDPNAPSS